MNLQLLKLEILQSLNPVFPILGINLLEKKILVPIFRVHWDSWYYLLFLLLLPKPLITGLLDYWHCCNFLILPFICQHPDDTKLNHVSPTKSVPISLWISPYPYCGLQAFMWPSLPIMTLTSFLCNCVHIYIISSYIKLTISSESFIHVSWGQESNKVIIFPVGSNIL